MTTPPPGPTQPGLSGWRQDYLQRFYASNPKWIPGQREYEDLIRDHTPEGGEALEIGPGPTNAMTRQLARRFERLDGLDISPLAETNEDLDEVFLVRAEDAWPVRPARYDAIIANCVLEHVADPRHLLAQAHAALKPGGTFIFRTPNRWHYVSLVAACTPHWFHEKVANRLRNLPAEADDPYPTFYRMNTARALRRQFAAAGLEEIALLPVEKEPVYGLSAKPLFLAFLLYERLVNSDPILSVFRSNLFGAFRKPTP